MTIAAGFACLDAAAAARRLARDCLRSAADNPRWAETDRAEAQHHKQRARDWTWRASVYRDPALPDRRR